MMKWTELTFDEQVELYNQEIWFVVSMWSRYTDCTQDASETEEIYLNIFGLSIDEMLERIEHIYGLSKSERDDYPGDYSHVIAYYFHDDHEYVIQHGSGSGMDIIINANENIKYI
jgi:hypothetical protein